MTAIFGKLHPYPCLIFCLFVPLTTVQRSTSAMQHCLDEALKAWDEALGRERRMTRDDWMHGSLLIINELLRCSNNEAEVGGVFKSFFGGGQGCWYIKMVVVERS